MNLTFAELSIEIDSSDTIVKVNKDIDLEFVGKNLKDITAHFNSYNPKSNDDVLHQYYWESLIHQYFFAPDSSLQEKISRMLCRCVDVSFEEARKMLLDNPDWGIQQICENLEVTAGCGKCVLDVKSLVNSLRQKNATPLQVALQVQKIIGQNINVLNIENETLTIDKPCDISLIREHFPYLSIQVSSLT